MFYAFFDARFCGLPGIDKTDLKIIYEGVEIIGPEEPPISDLDFENRVSARCLGFV